ncbi:hypothetical protein SMD44_07478 [Streptomyces alboflavus]|uniref:Uncharacterized protein n=1 Tax=Streptomyces alboflavus TaxID=67267 RepID=A0A1Z1WNW0_9ACTN|nr:hypothetical protein SMD44_07478 [Streptomyces alboflavus]
MLATMPMASILAPTRVDWPNPAKARRLSKASALRTASKTTKPEIIVSALSPAVISVMCLPPTLSISPVAYSLKSTSLSPAMAVISRYQSGTNSRRSSAARRLRLCSRTENRSAVGNWPYSGVPGRVSGAGMAGLLHCRVTGRQAAVDEVGEDVEALLLEDEMGDDDDGLVPLVQLVDEVPEAQVRLPVEALVRLVEEQDVRVVQERERQVELLAGAAGQVARRGVAVLFVAEQADQFVRAVQGGQAVGGGEVAQVLVDREVGVEDGVLGQ